MLGQTDNEQLVDYTDPFNAGQMVGMLVALMFVEVHGGINQDMLQKLKQVAAGNAQMYMDKPLEDILLMVDNIVKEINIT